MVYTYDGIQVYNGANDAPDPIINADLSSAPTEKNSATIINAVKGSIKSFSSDDDASLERINIVNSSTSTDLVYCSSGEMYNPPTRCISGHSPPITAGVAGGGTGAMFPVPSPIYIEGSPPPCSGDCHVATLDTSNDFVYEGGPCNIASPSSPLTCYNGIVDNLNDSYTGQYENKCDNVEDGGAPIIGTMLPGDDFALEAISHPIGVIMPRNVVASGTNHVNWSPNYAITDGTCGGTTSCLEYGDILRLTSSVTAPSDPYALKLYNALRKRGMAVVDTQGKGNHTASLRLALDINGRDDFGTGGPYSAVLTFWNKLALADFKLVERNYRPITPPGTGCTGT